MRALGLSIHNAWLSLMGACDSKILSRKYTQSYRKYTPEEMTILLGSTTHTDSPKTPFRQGKG